MKKLLLSALCLMTSLVASATDLFTGTKHVSWDEGGIQIAATEFANAKAGDKIVVTFSGATDGIEFKVMDDFDRLPGSLQFKGINGDGIVEQFLTPAAVAKLQAAGLEIIGANFTASKVELLDGKDNVEATTVWTGYYWMDEWSTLELAKSSFNGINWSDYKAIRFYSEAGRTDYVINIKTSWDEAGHIADAGTMTMTNEYAELSLEGIDMGAKLANADRLMVQCNKEGGAPFNFTAIVLVPNEATGINAINSVSVAGEAYDMSGRKVAANTKGIVIKAGKKFLVK